MTRLTGAWPGGPTRNSPPSKERQTFRVDSMEVRGDRQDEARQRRNRVRRRRRLSFTLGATAALAVALGAWLGLANHRTSEELTAERIQAQEEAGAGVVEELLSDPAVREMLEGERVEAAAAARSR